MTEIILHVEPGVVISWEEFQNTKPPFSIALDGYVSGRTMYSFSGPYANFNHHEDVDRMATRSTCTQIYFSIVLGLFDSFTKNGNPFAHVYVNDADQDVCLSYWLLTHSDQAESVKWEDPLAKLLILEDFMDASAGGFPFDDSHKSVSFLKQQAWVFEPYTNARKERKLHQMSAEEFVVLINEVCRRIDLFVVNKSKSIDLDMKPEIVGGGPGWKLIIEKSGYSRISIYASGTNAFVGMRQRSDGHYTYVLGKKSPYIPFPMEKIYEELNTVENLKSEDNQWGGSNIIGGSPRKTGSCLSPPEIEKVINMVIAQNN